jgi:SAM-dependent methyltransferase
MMMSLDMEIESVRPLKFWLEKLAPPAATAAWRRAKRHLTPAAQRELPVRSLSELFPGIGEITVDLPIAQLERPPGTLPLTELLVICATTRFLKPRRVFEIGTFRGASTVLLARHAPDGAEIFTLDLPPRETATRFAIDNGDITGVPFTVGEYYRGTPYEAKVKQLFGDSATFDYSPYAHDIDFVFVDGNHAYDNVKVDSMNAFELLKPGGTIIWDDYHPEWGAGVMRALHELRDRGLYRIAGTRFVAYVDASGSRA